MIGQVCLKIRNLKMSGRKSGQWHSLEKNISLKPRNKNIFLDLNIIWSKISYENRLNGFDMTDARLKENMLGTVTEYSRQIFKKQVTEQYTI